MQGDAPTTLREIVAAAATVHGWDSAAEMHRSIERDGYPSRRTAYNIWEGRPPKLTSWGWWARVLGVPEGRFAAACAASRHGGMSASSPSDDRAAS